MRTIIQSADRVSHRLLAIAVVLLSLWLLKLTVGVTMPLAFAMFLVILAWPLLRWLERRLPKWLCVPLTFLAVLAAFAACFGSLYLCAASVAAKAPEYGSSFRRLGQTIDSWAAHLGVHTHLVEGRVERLASGLGTAAAAVAGSVVDAGGALVLVVTFAMLGLPEIERWRDKVKRLYGEGMFGTVEMITTSCRVYVVTRTLTSAAMGILTGLFTWAVGLDFAFVWGFTSFLLNYIPTLGGLIAIIFPSLLAFVQLGSLRGTLVLTVLIAIHMILGNYVDPKLQAHRLSLSPLVLLFAIALWGWVWGVAGALLAVPLTVAIVVICAEFPSTAWIAEMLTDDGASNSPRA